MSSAPKSLCVIGDPIAHSLSPAIHNAWLRHAGIHARYDILRVTQEALPAFIENIKTDKILGANVTVPHKQSVFHLCKHVTERAKAIGAVNTLWKNPETQDVRGDSTDGEGFIAALHAKAPGFTLKNTKAVMLGGGGSARAIVHALLSAGVKKINVCVRAPSKIESLQQTFGDAVQPTPWQDAPQQLSDADLLINTVPPGKDGGNNVASHVANALRPELTIYDIVYYPLLTPLLQAAARAGATIITGEGMLLYQAAAAFTLWFGLTPDIPVGHAALTKALEQQHHN